MAQPGTHVRAAFLATAILTAACGGESPRADADGSLTTEIRRMEQEAAFGGQNAYRPGGGGANAEADAARRQALQAMIDAQWEQERQRARESYRQCMDSKRAMSESGSLTSASSLDCSQWLTLMSAPPTYVPQTNAPGGQAPPPPKLMSNEEFQQFMQEVMTIP